MKRLSFAVLSSYLLLLFGACQPEERIAPIEEPNAPINERTIVYTVADHPADTIHLTSEAEWEALLDRLLDYAEEGNSVTFYNADRARGEGCRLAAWPKEDHTLTTTSRDEMKAWCRQMERLGLTVVVAYDRTTGTWSGTAYASAPTTEEDSTAILKGKVLCREGDGMPGGSDVRTFPFECDVVLVNPVTRSVIGYSSRNVPLAALRTTEVARVHNQQHNGQYRFEGLPAGTYSVLPVVNDTVVVAGVNLGGGNAEGYVNRVVLTAGGITRYDITVNYTVE